ncbi:MAG: tetratricopeptide repeat protein [Blastocatellia bacterium]
MPVIFIFLFLISVVAVNAQSTRVLQFFEKGMRASQSGDHAAALNNFNAALSSVEREGAVDKFFAKLHYNIGVSNYHLRNLDEASAEFEIAIKLSRGNYEKASYALGLTQAELGNWAAAEKAFRGAVAANNRNGEAWFDLAFVHLSSGDRKKAFVAFEKAVRHNASEKAVSNNNLGVLLAIRGDYRSALKHFKLAVAESNGQYSDFVANLDLCRRLINSKHEMVASKGFEMIYRNGTRKPKETI